MAQLTAGEKQYFIKRVQRIIDTAITRVKDQEPGFEDKLRETAHATVMTRLGLTIKYRKYEQAKADLEKAKKLVASYEEDMAKAIPEDVASKYWAAENRLDRGIDRLTDKEIEVLRSQSAIGKQVKALADVRASVEDAIMLASTSPQMIAFVKEISKKYGDILSETEGLALAVFSSSPTAGPEAAIETAVAKSKAK